MSTAVSTPVPSGFLSVERDRRSRPWPPVVMVGLYWLAYGVVSMFDIGGFQKFLAVAGMQCVLLLSFVAWWMFSRRVARDERWHVLRFAAAIVLLSLLVKSSTIKGPLVMSVLMPSVAAMLTGWGLWYWASSSASTTVRRRGMVAVAALAWFWFLPLRMEGLTGGAKSQFFWRWTPSGEEQFLASRGGDTSVRNTPTDAATEPLVATDADWPEFRGPLRDGVVRGVSIDADWDASPPKERWSNRIGPGWSSITIVGDRLYTQEQRGPNEAVVCLDADTGDELWSREDPGRFDEAMGGVGPRATPTFAAGRIYALGANGLLNCLDAVTGRVIWAHDIKPDGQGAVPPWGFSSSPLVVDDKVIVFAGGGQTDDADADSDKDAQQKNPLASNNETLVAYDAHSGALKWRAASGSHSYSSPQLATIDGIQQVLFTSDVALDAVDPADGQRLWRLPTNAKEAAPPCLQPHLLSESELLALFNGDAGLVHASVAHDGDHWNVEALRVSRGMKPFFSDFVRVGDALYGFDGNLFCCLDANTGKRRWKKGRYGSGQVLLVADQPALVVITESGEAVLVAANPDKLEELGRFQAVEGKTWNHPTIVGGRLYVRNAEKIACYEL